MHNNEVVFRRQKNTQIGMYLYLCLYLYKYQVSISLTNQPAHQRNLSSFVFFSRRRSCHKKGVLLESNLGRTNSCRQ